MKKSIKLISLLLALCMLSSLFACSKKAEEPEAEEIQEQVDTVAEKLETVKSDKDYEDLDSDEKADLIMDELKALSKKGYVNADTIYYDEDTNIITYAYGSGVLACEAIDEFDENVCGMPLDSIVSRKDEVYLASDEKKADALILWALSDQPQNYPYCSEMAQEWSKAGVKTRIDSSVTLDDLCNLYDYEFVFFELHGIYLDFKYVKKELVTSVIVLDQKPNNRMNKKYQYDLQTYGIGVFNGNRYFVASKFFENHYDKGDFSDSIFVFGSCELMGKGTVFCHDWDKSLESASLSALIGFHNTVYTNYNLSIVSGFMESLLFFGGTTEEAFNYTVDLYGDSDVDYIKGTWNYFNADHDVAFPILMGNYEAKFPWEMTDCPIEESTYQNSTELYKKYINEELTPQYGWTSTATFETYLDTSCGEGYAYNPIDDRIEAEGIISADIDDYNKDGVDDMIVVYMYKESTYGMDSVYTMPEFVYSPQTEIYRTRLAAFTILDGSVVKTDEYDVIRYGYSKEKESIIGCLFPQEQDLKDLYIYKMLNDDSISIQIYSRVTSGPMFRFFNQSSWMMGLDSNGKFYMQSSYIYWGSGVDYSCTVYEFTNGVETSCQEYVEDPHDPSTTPSLTDYFDEHQIACDYGYMNICDTDNQIKIAGYSTSISHDQGSPNYGYYYYADFFDGGNLSTELR